MLNERIKNLMLKVVEVNENVDKIIDRLSELNMEVLLAAIESNPFTTDARLKALVMDKTRPKTRNEREIAGYRDVLNTIHDSYEYIPPKPSTILQLHRDLYKFGSYDVGGKYKSADNIIEEEDEQGNKFVRFKPVSAWETPENINSLFEAFNRWQEGKKSEKIIEGVHYEPVNRMLQNNPFINIVLQMLLAKDIQFTIKIFFL